MLLWIAAMLFIAYWGLGVILFFMQPKFLYKPLPEVTYTPGELGLDFEDVTFSTDDGVKLTGWYVPADESKPTILFCHGNGGNMMHRLDSINIFNNLGLNCFIFDYRGYGQSRGRPTEEGTYVDAAASYRYLTEDKMIEPEDIIIFGRSLGGSIAAQLATNVKAQSLVIESSFTSYVDIGETFYPYMPVRWFAAFGYKTAEYLRDVDCPVMIIHSRNDEIIPFELGLELHEIANEPKRMVEINGSHNDGFLISGEIYKKAWTSWLKELQQCDTGADRQQVS
jgi:fermentation-respiration switch protein FrsA (DUF1100 family)